MCSLLLPIGVVIGLAFMWFVTRKWPEEMYRDGHWDGSHGMPSLYPDEHGEHQ